MMKNRPDIRCVGVLILTMYLTLSCTRVVHQPGKRQIQEVLALSRTIDDSLMHYGAVIIMDESDLEISKDQWNGVSVKKRHRIIQIIDDHGFSSANVMIPYRPYMDVSHIWGRTILSAGTEVKLSDNQIFDTNLHPDYMFYSSARAYRFSMPAIEQGCIIEYGWQEKLNQWAVENRWQFQHDFPVLNSRYSIVFPKEMPIKWKTYGIAIDPVVEEWNQQSRYRYTWEVNNMEPLIPEVSMSRGLAEIPHLMFSPVPFVQWDDVASWYWAQLETQCRSSKAIVDKAGQLTEGSTSPAGQLQALFEFVRDKIRYVAVEMGDGGYQPRPAGEVLKDRYGDCKDKVCLLIALANAVDLNVHPVLISTWDHGVTDTSLVSHAHFNHVIAWANLPFCGEIWMDPTDQWTPFASLPWYDQGRLTVIARSGGKADLQRSPEVSAYENRSHRQWHIVCDKYGGIQGRVSIFLHGAMAKEMRREMKSRYPGNVPAWFRGQLMMQFPFTTCSRVQIIFMDDLDKPLLIKAEFTSSKLMIRNGDLFSMLPGQLSGFDWYRLFTDTERRYSIELKHSLSVSDQIHISYPKTWTGISGFSADSMATPFGDYRRKMTAESFGEAYYHRFFEITQTRISPSGYASFLSFLHKIAERDQDPVVFRQTDTRNIE